MFNIDLRGTEAGNGRRGWVEMVVLEAGNVWKAYGSTTILEKVSFKVRRGEKVGLVGPNGCGKSTLLKMIAGRGEITEGNIRTPRGVRIGYLAQEMAYRDGNTVHQELCRAFGAVQAVETELRTLESALEQSAPTGSSHETQLTLDRYGCLMETFEQLGGFDYERKIDAVLDGLRLSAHRDRPVATLSGGEKNIVALARSLLEEPDILLLDEPANHLDFQSREQVEEALEAFEGTVFVISHDRYFLDRIVDRIVEIREAGLKEYPGGFSHYWEQRHARRTGPKPRGRRIDGKATAQRAPANVPGEQDPETRIHALEEQKLDLERGIAAACRNGKYREGDRLGRKLSRLERQIEALYEAL